MNDVFWILVGAYVTCNLIIVLATVAAKTYVIRSKKR